MFTESNIFRNFEAGSFNLPPPRQILRTNITLPYVLLGDQGYPLKEYLVRPYPTDNAECLDKTKYEGQLKDSWKSSADGE